MCAVVTPGRSDPRAAMARDSARRTRSCAGLPITVWSRSRTWMASAPSLLATGPRLPTWQSPQIQALGPSGKADRADASNHS